MFIAVSNAHGWAKADTEREALDEARRNSVVRDGRLRVKVWDCTDDAYCDGHGVPWGILSAPEGREYAPVKGQQWLDDDAHSLPLQDQAARLK